MIKIVAKFTIKEDKIAEFKNHAADLAAETRKENGCISYELFQDINDLKVLAFIEEWESKDALDSHMESKHFKEIFSKMAKIQEKDPEVSMYSLVL